MEYHGTFISFKRKIYSKQGSHIFCLGTWTLVSKPHTGAQPEFFQGRGGLVELGYFDKQFVKNTKKKAPQENIFGLFSPTVKITFQMKSIIQRWIQSGTFFQN